MHYCQSCDEPTRMEPAGTDTAVCPACGSQERALRAPFLVVTGASGSGKTALLGPLARKLAGVVAVFDIDWLIDPFVMQAGEGGAVNWPAVRAAWLSVAAALAQGGLPSLLLAPIAPFHLDDLPQARWIGPTHFFLLDCPDGARRERMEARPPWRGRDRERQIEDQTRWAGWLREHVPAGVDTSRASVDETAKAVATWARTVLRLGEE